MFAPEPATLFAPMTVVTVVTLDTSKSLPTEAIYTQKMRL